MAREKAERALVLRSTTTTAAIADGSVTSGREDVQSADACVAGVRCNDTDDYV